MREDPLQKLQLWPLLLNASMYCVALHCDALRSLIDFWSKLKRWSAYSNADSMTRWMILADCWNVDESCIDFSNEFQSSVCYCYVRRTLGLIWRNRVRLWCAQISCFLHISQIFKFLTHLWALQCSHSWPVEIYRKSYSAGLVSYTFGEQLRSEIFSTFDRESISPFRSVVHNSQILKTEYAVRGEIVTRAQAPFLRCLLPSWEEVAVRHYAYFRLFIILEIWCFVVVVIQALDAHLKIWALKSIFLMDFFCSLDIYFCLCAWFSFDSQLCVIVPVVMVSLFIIFSRCFWALCTLRC